MKVTIDTQGDRRILRLDGRLDASSGPAVEGHIDITGVRELVLDLAACPYVSSAGLRVILLAHKRMGAAGGTFVVRNPVPAVRDMFEMTGLSKFITLVRTAREISLEGCELLSSGVTGECFRLDGETVVKLFKDGIDIAMAEQEKRYAEAAFILGIPTAISYDVVTCGSRSGVVFELLDAELFSSVIRREPHLINAHAKRLAGLAANLHAASGNSQVLPRLKDRIRGHIHQLRGTFGPAEIALLLERLDAVPEVGTCVHFDLHSSNIMVQGEELVIIDMGDFSIGSGLFDVGLLYLIYGLPELGMCELATKVETALGVEFWSAFADHYFAGRPPEERAFFESNRHFFASLRLVCAINCLPHIREKLTAMVRDVLLPRIALESRSAVAP